jgi:hypothetical protein
MAPATRVTTNHDEIRRWAEERGGRPSRVKGTGRGEDPGILRIDFPGFSGADTLEPISWDEWFRAFDRKRLAFLYQDVPNRRFNKLIDRDSAGARPTRGRARPARATARARTAARSRTARKRR